ncbi:hypothetical protein F5879DRAFT_45997 [Lentinula edodes]|nr:hypothetical protein F5879DRAFT_45997 [Lentinula edodes]
MHKCIVLYLPLDCSLSQPFRGIPLTTESPLATTPSIGLSPIEKGMEAGKVTHFITIFQCFGHEDCFIISALEKRFA